MKCNGKIANNCENYIHTVVSCYTFIENPIIAMECGIVHGNLFPGFAHSLHVECLTVANIAVIELIRATIRGMDRMVSKGNILYCTGYNHALYGRQ